MIQCVRPVCDPIAMVRPPAIPTGDLYRQMLCCVFEQTVHYCTVEHLFLMTKMYWYIPYL